MYDYEPKIRRGIALLDLKMPGWRSRMDWARLDVGNPFKCVLGQQPAGLVETAKRLGLGYEFGPTSLFEHGFACGEGGDYEVLTEEWLRVIRNGDIGDPVREVEFEPMPTTVPITEPSPVPAEPVPA